MAACALRSAGRLGRKNDAYEVNEVWDRYGAYPLPAWTEVVSNVLACCGSEYAPATKCLPFLGVESEGRER